jgi:hypothetical protein
LNDWNDVVRWINLRRADANQLIIHFTLPGAVLVTALWGAAYTLAVQLLLALNIGTTGFFWWRQRDDLARFFERLRDLEAGEEVVIERVPSLKAPLGWRSRAERGGYLTCHDLLRDDAARRR